MAQIKFSVNLTSADFVLSHTFKGRSVIVPGIDQNYYQATAGFAGNTPQRGINIPQLYYCENTVPTAEGYRSVAYRYFIEPPAIPGEFVKVLTVFDGGGNSALVGVTKDRRLYIVSAYTSGSWIPLPLPAPHSWDTNLPITTATVTGVVAFCLREVGVFTLDISTSTLTHQPLTGIDGALIHGICAAVGYTIAWDASTIYWSSTLDPWDFIPSLISGAGSATPQGLRGRIILCKELAEGFAIYSDITILSAAYSSNLAIPWVFAVLKGGAGVRNIDAVAHDTNMSSHFAWTSAGLLTVELHKVNLAFPQVTDFIASGLADHTTTFDDYPISEFTDGSKEVRLSYISSRYLCISFGFLEPNEELEFSSPKLTQSFLFDSELERWGKLNVDHVQIFESPFSTEPPVLYLTGWPYAYEFSDSMTTTLPGFANVNMAYFVDSLASVYPGITGGTSTLPYVNYTNWPHETLQTVYPSITGGISATPFINYTAWPHETMQTVYPGITGGTSVLTLVSYTNWPAETLQTPYPSITGGTSA